MDPCSNPRFLGFCKRCGMKITEKGCKALDDLYHRQCFTCFVCGKELYGKPFYSMDGTPYCEEDYLNLLEKCTVCNKPVLDRMLKALDKAYHPSCFKCSVCGKSLDGIPYTCDKEKRIYCIPDFQRRNAHQCWRCKQLILPEPGKEVRRITAMGHNFHPTCYRCEDCGLQLSSQIEGHGCYPLDGKALCRKCNAKKAAAKTRGTATT